MAEVQIPEGAMFYFSPQRLDRFWDPHILISMVTEGEFPGGRAAEV
jgi:hypothetical protein